MAGSAQNPPDRPAFVPGFKHDIFVSYAHVDNVSFPSDEPASGWVHTLVSNVQKLLSQGLGRQSRGKIWLDRGMRGNESVTPEVRDAVSNAAVLVIILGNGYLSSQWCDTERELFLDAAAGSGGVEGRIFVVEQTEFARPDWPEPIRDLKGYRFYRKEHPDAPARTMGMPVFDPKDKLHFTRIDDLAQDLVRKLKEMRDARAEDASEVEEAEDAITVFLAEATPDLEDDRANLRRQLEQVGLHVLPNSYYDRTPAAFRQAMETDLAASVCFVQLLGRYTSPKTHDLPQGYEGLQLQLAEGAGKPILRWRSPELDLASVDDEHRRSLEHQDVQDMPFEEFKTEVEEKARLFAVQARMTEEDLLALLSPGRDDLVIANQISEVLERQDIGFDIIDEDVPLAKLAMDHPYDALMVFYGRAPQDWAQGRVRECRTVMIRKQPDPPVCAIYVAPDAPEPLRIRPRKFFMFGSTDDMQFKSFVAAVQRRGGAH